MVTQNSIWGNPAGPRGGNARYTNPDTSIKLSRAMGIGRFDWGYKQRSDR